MIWWLLFLPNYTMSLYFKGFRYYVLIWIQFLSITVNDIKNQKKLLPPNTGWLQATYSLIQFELIVKKKYKIFFSAS